jgi:hypothetical protein
MATVVNVISYTGIVSLVPFVIRNRGESEKYSKTTNKILEKNGKSWSSLNRANAQCVLALS